MKSLVDGFVRELRTRGVRVSTAEGIDAARATLAVGIESKSALRRALRATLCKRREEIPLFDEIFDRYFASPRRAGASGATEPAGTGERAGGSRGSGEAHGGGPPPAGRPQTAPPARRRLRVPTGRRRPLEPGRPGGKVPVAAPPRASGRAPRLILERGLAASSAFETRGDEGTHGAAPARRIPLRGFVGTEDEARLAREIPSIIEEIRLRRGRRFTEGPRGRLWVKKMIRDSLAHGGVPFSLPMKRRRPRRPRVALLVDVSHSVTRAAGYFLLICRGLAARLGRTEVHVFVDRVAEATQAIRRWAARRGGDLDFAGTLSTLPGIDLEGASDYGRAFHQALGFVGRSSGRETVLVVLGDARSNHRDPLAWAFEDLSGRCRKVLWLNPEGHLLWDTGDSVMRVYAPSCDVVCEARDLEGLANGVRAILRSL